MLGYLFKPVILRCGVSIFPHGEGEKKNAVDIEIEYTTATLNVRAMKELARELQRIIAILEDANA